VPKDFSMRWLGTKIELKFNLKNQKMAAKTPKMIFSKKKKIGI